MTTSPSASEAASAARVPAAAADLRRRLEEALRPFRAATAALAAADGEERTLALAAAVLDERDRLPPLPDGLGTAEDVGAALEVLADLTARLAARKAYAAELVAAAERELDAARRVLAVPIEAWAEAHRPRRGKTLRLPTGGTIRWRMTRGAVRVTSQAEAVAALEAAYGALGARERGLVRDKAEVVAGELRPLLEAGEAVRGVALEAPAERIYY